MPKNGGVQEYLREVYGDFSGFMFSWVYLAICKPCANAVIAMVFADYLSMAAMSSGPLATWEMKLVALVGLLVITIVNCAGNATGAKAANLFLFLKLSAVASIAIVGILMAVSMTRGGMERLQVEWFAKDPNLKRQGMPLWALAGDFITAVFGALFCYGGWETVGLNVDLDGH